MKIAGMGVITSLTQNEDDGVDVDVEFKCKALPEPGDKIGTASSAKEASAAVTLNVKNLVAEKLSWGQKLYVTFSTEPFKEE